MKLIGVIFPIGLRPSLGIAVYVPESNQQLHIAILDDQNRIAHFQSIGDANGLLFHRTDYYRVCVTGDYGVFVYLDERGKARYFDRYDQLEADLLSRGEDRCFRYAPFFELDVAYQLDMPELEKEAAKTCLMTLYGRLPRLAQIWVEEGVMSDETRINVRSQLADLLHYSDFDVPKITKDTIVWVTSDLIPFTRVNTENHKNIVIVSKTEIYNINLNPRILFISRDILLESIKSDIIKKRLMGAVRKGLKVIHVVPHPFGMNSNSPVIVDKGSDYWIKLLNVSTSADNFVDFLGHYMKLLERNTGEENIALARDA